MELASESLSPASQYVKNHVDSILSCLFLCYCTRRARFWIRMLPLVILYFLLFLSRWVGMAVAASLLTRLCACRPYDFFCGVVVCAFFMRLHRFVVYIYLLSRVLLPSTFCVGPSFRSVFWPSQLFVLRSVLLPVSHQLFRH